MPELPNSLRIVRVEQDEYGNIIGGEILFPPREERALSMNEAVNEYQVQSLDGFEIHQQGNLYHITPLFGDANFVKDVPVFRNDRANVGNLIDALTPLLERNPKKGARTAVIYRKPIPQ